MASSASRALLVALGLAVSTAGCLSQEGSDPRPPTVGDVAAASTRSLEGLSEFDRIVQPGLGRELPKTFRELVTLVEARTKGVAAVTLIPKGRSLVRDATTFADPRVVVGVFSGDAKDVAHDGVSTGHAGIFLGFSKATGLVEVVSYNPIAGRFDFEVIENFGTGVGTPRVRMAERELCTSCHTMGTPIFSVGLWSETIEHNPKLLAASKKAMGHAEDARGVRYEGFDVADTATEDFVDPGVAFESFADDASKRLVANDLWAKTCKDDAACRAGLVAFALYSTGQYWNHGMPAKKDAPFYVASKKVFDDARARTGLVELRPLSPVLASRDPLATPALTPDTDPVGSEPVSRSLYRSSEMDLFSVATSFDFVGGVFTDDDAERVRNFLSARPGTTFGAGLEAAASGPWRAADWAKTNGPLVRCDVLENVAPGVRFPGCALPADLDAVRAKKATATGAGSAELAPFRTSCGGCHASGSVTPAFLAPPPEGASDVALFRSWAHCIAPVLAWDEPGSRVMPPKSSPRHAELANDPELRRRMANLARIEATAQRALAGSRAGTNTGLATGVCPSSVR